MLRIIDVKMSMKIPEKERERERERERGGGGAYIRRQEGYMTPKIEKNVDFQNENMESYGSNR